MPAHKCDIRLFYKGKLLGHDVSHLGRDLPPMDGPSNPAYKDLRCDEDARGNERKERGEKKEARHQGPRDWQMSRVTSGGRRTNSHLFPIIKSL